MNDQPGSVPLALVQQQAANPIDPEQLELMGKQAAKLYRSQGCRLNDAVVQIVKTAQLAPEQVKRVCEFANTSAYLEEFEKAGEMRNITFDGGPANPGVVLQELNDGTAPAIHQVDSSDYNEPVSSYKVAAAGDDFLARAFGHGGMQKVAEANHSLHADPIEDLRDMRIKLSSMRDNFNSTLSSMRVGLDDVESDLLKEATQAVVDGVSLGDIRRAWGQTGADDFFVKKAMVSIGKHLQARGVDRDALSVSYTKVAGAGIVANPAHPLMSKFAAFAKMSRELMKLGYAVEVAETELAKVNAQIKRSIS